MNNPKETKKSKGHSIKHALGTDAEQSVSALAAQT